jgi:class 3 adenylate cyclase/ActR/RegA family two-component response regulator
MLRVLLADDNLIVRAGVRALLEAAGDIEVVGVAASYDELVDAAVALEPQVVVTDIRMPPTLTDEGIRAARLIRKQHPGTGIVILSQYDEPEYAIALLGEGAAGYAYLLKDRVAEGDQLFRAVRAVASGGSMLDPRIVDALARPVAEGSGLTPAESQLLRMVAEGRPMKAIAVTLQSTPATVSDDIERVFLKLAQQASAGTHGALQQLRLLHLAIVDREEQGETLSRFLPRGVAAKLREDEVKIGESEQLTVTVLTSDIRGYTTISEKADPSVLARQLHEHRTEMDRGLLSEGGTVMQFVGDAVMAVFGAPVADLDHAERALRAALLMHSGQALINERWEAEGLPPFQLGIGISTGVVAALLLGSKERLEYTVVGDAVNLSQRIQQWAEPGETVLSEPTYAALTAPPEMQRIEPALVKGRKALVGGYRLAAAKETRALPQLTPARSS